MDFAVFTMVQNFGCCFAQGIEPASAQVSKYHGNNQCWAVLDFYEEPWVLVL
jgi:hypothetical protein